MSMYPPDAELPCKQPLTGNMPGIDASSLCFLILLVMILYLLLLISKERNVIHNIKVSNK